MEQIFLKYRPAKETSGHPRIMKKDGRSTITTKGKNPRPMTNSTKMLFTFTLCAFILNACCPTEGRSHIPLASPSASAVTLPETESPPAQPPNLATPVSQEPAAGICGSFEGEWVVITVNPDIPDPRCAIINPDQMLKVVNGRQVTLQVSIADMTTTIEPGGEHTFDTPFGQYLAPGVHLIEVNPCCGASLLLK
jgi:hypothetical protein